MPPPDTKVGVPPFVQLRADTDLSVQVDTVAPLEGGVPVPAGSVPSNQRTQPLTLLGVKVVNTVRFAGVFVRIGILLCQENFKKQMKEFQVSRLHLL